MNEIYLIKPDNTSSPLNDMIKAFNEVANLNPLSLSEEFDLRNKKLVLAVELDQMGYCKEIYEFISKLYRSEKGCMKGSSAVLLIYSQSDLFTKKASQDILFLLNRLGCEFMGHPVVEATLGLNNLQTWQKTTDASLEEISRDLCKRLAVRFLKDTKEKGTKPQLAVLHASSNKTSNTLALWDMIYEKLPNWSLKELHVENGTVKDCRGCSFKQCAHYSSQQGCFYGGMMIEEIYPAIEDSEVLIWLAPNYNDALSANLTAVINRITALYRKMSFYDKSIYAIIVSGSSGSDSLARQLIGALCINKGFRLPPFFCMMETANDPGAIRKVKQIDQKVEAFAKTMRAYLE